MGLANRLLARDRETCRGWKMGPCDALRENLAALSALQPEERPSWAREHVAGCTACARALWAHQVMQTTVDALLLQRERTTQGPSDEIL